MEQDVHGHQSFELWRQVLEIDRFREVLRGSPIGLLEATGLASASHVLVGGHWTVQHGSQPHAVLHPQTHTSGLKGIAVMWFLLKVSGGDQRQRELHCPASI